MQRFFLFGIVPLGLALFGIGMFFWWSDGQSINYENPSRTNTIETSLGSQVKNREDVQSGISEQIAVTEAETKIEEGTVSDTSSQEAQSVSVKTFSQGEALNQKLTVKENLVNFGFRRANGRMVDTIVLHSSYNASGGDVYDIDKIVKQYEDYRVSAHYLIGRTGDIYRLVPESDIAYHAGASKMPDGRKNVNEFSIGVEMVGTLESGYTKEQYRAVNALIADIESRYKIKDVVGHADIAPDRKTDPWNFDWNKLNS